MLKSDLIDLICDFCADCGGGQTSSICTGHKKLAPCPIFGYQSWRAQKATKIDLMDGIRRLCAECQSEPEPSPCHAADCPMANFWAEN
jgi:hypothetical protein